MQRKIEKGRGLKRTKFSQWALRVMMVRATVCATTPANIPIQSPCNIQTSCCAASDADISQIKMRISFAFPFLQSSTALCFANIMQHCNYGIPEKIPQQQQHKLCGGNQFVSFSKAKRT